MTSPHTRRHRFGILGIGAAACVACCIGPLVALLGGLSLAGLASTLLIGAAGLVIAAVAAVGFVVVRRRRPPGIVDDGPAPVAPPARRAPS